MARVFTEQWNDYELIDAGRNQKLERWGKIITIRPERNAYFTAVMSNAEWRAKAHFIFNEISSTKGEWECLKPGTPDQWQISYQDLVFNLKLTQFKHIGIFPEQRTNWDFISEKMIPERRFLNLFAYTGGASLAAQKKGSVTYHCDAVKQINGWATENMESSLLSGIHWVNDDALKFAQREAKRGNRYFGISMDPPAFGIGAKKERWKIEDKFPELLETAVSLLEPNGFLILNTYSPRLTADKIKEQVSKSNLKDKKLEVNTLSLKSTTGKIIEYGVLTRVY